MLSFSEDGAIIWIVTRRQLIATLAAAAPAFSAPRSISVGMQTSAWKLALDDWPGFLKVLGEIRALGYDGFETSFRNVQSMFGKKAKDARAELAAKGLRFFGCHILLSDYDAKTNIPPMDQIEPVAEGAASLGAERLIVSGSPVRGDEGPMDPQRLSWKAGALNRAGRHCQQFKMRVCYHNHGPEFANDAEEITALMKETDSDNVRFIIDAGDALRAKVDLASFFAKYHKRIDGMHLRDFNAQNVQAPLGQGTFAYEPLAAAVKKAKWTGWVIAEEERESGEKPGEKAAAAARERIRALFGV